MEKDILRDTSAKKESARDIARRLKGSTRSDSKETSCSSAAAAAAATAAAAAGGGGGGDAAMGEDGDENRKEEEDVKEEYERAITTWNDMTHPLKLSIEIMTNLFTGMGDTKDDGDGGYYEDDDGGGGGGAMDVDMDDIASGWDSDREEKLMAKVQQDQSSSSLLFKKKDIASNDDDDAGGSIQRRLQVVGESGLPESVSEVFGKVLLLLLSPPPPPPTPTQPTADMNTDDKAIAAVSKNHEYYPKIMTQDLIEILSKCATCLGNVLCNLPDWRSQTTDDGGKTKAIFQDLITSLREVTTRRQQQQQQQLVEKEKKDGSSDRGDTQSSSSLSLSYCGIIAALISTLTAFVRFRPVSMGFVGSEELDLILACALIEDYCGDDEEDEEERQMTAAVISDMQKDAISIIGMLSSQPHPHEINVKMCTTLATVLTRSTNSTNSNNSNNTSSSSSITTSVMSETLNVLMDMYSADEGDPHNHENVFRSMNVLEAMQRCAPVFKRKIRQEEVDSDGGLGSSGTEEEDILSVWKETSLNVTRFVRYKKGR